MNLMNLKQQLALKMQSVIKYRILKVTLLFFCVCYGTMNPTGIPRMQTFQINYFPQKFDTGWSHKITIEILITNKYVSHIFMLVVEDFKISDHYIQFLSCQLNYQQTWYVQSYQYMYILNTFVCFLLAFFPANISSMSHNKVKIVMLGF